MAKNSREIFSTDGTYVYNWAAGSSHPKLTGQLIIADGQDQVDGAILINALDEIGNNACTVTAQLRISPPGVTESWGVEHNLLDTSATPVNTFNATASGGKFEANLYEQSWWKPNYGFRILISRTTDRVISLTNHAIVK